ncbi:MAG: histidine-type phosphatase [Bacteroidales bacterium]|nr:histidine-type phosphatase [Bacteroidales bacterium]
MKRFLTLALLLASTLAAYAQLSPEMDAYLRAFPQRASFNIHSYEFLPLEDTPAPRGFKPFYISHYGRHGSRAHLTDEPYLLLQDCLQAASEEGIITPAGDSLLACAKQMVALHDGMEGRLTPRGAREHEQLARRMYKRYRRVFRHGEVHAISSTVPRCLVSMAAFTSALKSCRRRLPITWDCGPKFQRIISPHFPKDIMRKASGIAHGPLTDVPVDTMAIFSRFFKDPVRGKALAGKPRKFVSAIFSLAQFAEAYDIDENRFTFLPWDAVTTAYARHALTFYIGRCNSEPYGEENLKWTDPLVGDIVSKADEAIAGAPVAANLIFGHDMPLLALCSRFGLEGYGYPRLTAEEAYRSWNGTLHCPFAANLQIIFYSNRKGEVLVKFLTNERETPIPELQAYSGPYYRWEDAKAYAMNKKLQ